MQPFFLIWTGQAFSILGSSIVQFALVWWMTRTTGSATVLATATFVAFIPEVLIMPFAGALVDRWNRRRVMIIADSCVALATLGLVYLFWQGLEQLWHVYLILFIRSFGVLFHWTAMQASTSLMVPQAHLSRINGMNESLRGALKIVSPPLAALLIGLLPMFNILAVDVITAAVAILSLLMVKIPQPERSAVEKTFSARGVLADVAHGFRYVRAWTGLAMILLVATLLNFFQAPSTTLLPLLVTQHFNGGIWHMSIAQSSSWIGILAGGLVLSAWGGTQRRIYTTLGGVIGIAIGVLLQAAAPADWFLLAIFGFALAGFMIAIANGPLYAILQSRVAPEMQGRVFALISTVSSATVPLSMVVAGPLAEWMGVRTWYWIGGVGCLILGVGALFLRPIVLIEEETVHI
ncbi:MAG TPA: MFS transporter [Levilinea sp.]|nr:MFS transporter [Levilinea sp.]